MRNKLIAVALVTFAVAIPTLASDNGTAQVAPVNYVASIIQAFVNSFVV
ncbi:MAG: hypothetical protein ACK5NT_07120 [Pyrinomonadaceae bacterium]